MKNPADFLVLKNRNFVRYFLEGFFWILHGINLKLRSEEKIATECLIRIKLSKRLLTDLFASVIFERIQQISKNREPFGFVA